jgi:hypothetical protein
MKCCACDILLTSVARIATRFRRAGDDFLSVLANEGVVGGNTTAAALDLASVLTNSRRVQRSDFVSRGMGFGDGEFIATGATLIVSRTRVNVRLRFGPIPKQPKDNEPQQWRPADEC